MIEDAGARRASIGFGVTGPLALRWYSGARAEALIERALGAGVGFFDTAPFYGQGLGERRLAGALAKSGRPVILSTKVGTRWRGGFAPVAAKDFSEGAVRAQVVGSLGRLGRDRVDIAYLHGPNLEQTHEGLAALRTLKDEGLVARIGVCQDHPWLLEQAIESGIDAVMAPLNFVDRRLESTLALAKARGVHVAAISTLAQAFYAKDARRIRRPADVWRRVRQAVRQPQRMAEAASLCAAMTEALGAEAVGARSLPGAALAWATANPAVDVAIVTTTNAAHLEDLLAGAGSPLSAAESTALEAVGSAFAPRVLA